MKLKTIIPVILVFTVAAIFWIRTPEVPTNEVEPVQVFKKKKIKKYRKDKPEEFAKFHNLIRTKSGEKYSSYPINYQFIEFQKAKDRLKNSGVRSGAPLPWEERGPGNVGGRTRSIVVDSRDDSFNTWFVGAVGGGIWKTEDRGETWRNLTEDMPNLGVSSMVQTHDPEIFYAATGNAFVSRGTNGNGIWKSLDGGESWNMLPSTQNDSFTNIFRIAVNPIDKNELLACTAQRRDIGYSGNQSRILRSVDGGQSWTQIIQKGGGRIHQVLYANEQVAFASVNGEGILRSDDQGITWDFVWQPDANDYRYGRIELTALDTMVYAAVDGTNGNEDRIYKSNDGGESWFNAVRPNGNSISGWLGGQGWFDNTIGIHPTEPNIVFAAGQSAMIKLETSNEVQDSLWYSNFTVVADGYNNYGQFVGSKGVHVDHHALQLLTNPSTGDLFLINGNDGGVSYSTDGGNTFKQTGDTFKDRDGTTYETLRGYNTSQFYGVDKMNGADRYIGGTQDNGSWISGYNPDEQSEWVHAPSGDGFEAAWNYADSNLVLESSQFNSIFRSTDGGNTWLATNLPPGNGPFITRIANSKLSPGLVFLTSNNGLVRSSDFGATWRTITMPPTWIYNGSTGGPVEISLASPRVVWSGSAITIISSICVSIDGGNTFRPTNNQDSISIGTITGLATHPLDEKTAYVLSSIPDVPKILMTRDLGQTWTDLSAFDPATGESQNGYPDVATYSLLVMPFDTNWIWAGTEIGIFESRDGGQSWAISDNGLPAASVWEMKIVNDEVVLATFGRGIWSVSLPELDGYEPVATLSLPELGVDKNFGSDVSGFYRLASPFDSSRFIVSDDLSGMEIANISIPANTDVIQEPFQYDAADFILEDTIQNIRIKLVAYDDTLVLSEEVTVEVFSDYKNVVTDYENDFDTQKIDFARRGFNVGTGGNTGLSEGMNSPHPYPGNNEFLTILRQPIMIEGNTTLLFDEIVLVEPGDSQDPDNSAFYDFVTVEATNNRGETWVRLDKYDSSFDPVWQAGYDNNASGNPGLITAKELDLGEYFSGGDIVFLRFRLASDPLVEGWGWWFDNINIVSDVTSVKPVVDNSLNLQINPNPFIDEFQFSFELNEKSAVRVGLYDINGREVQSILNGTFNAGSYNRSVAGSDLMPGIYFVNIIVAEGERHVTRKIVKQ